MIYTACADRRKVGAGAGDRRILGGQRRSGSQREREEGERSKYLGHDEKPCASPCRYGNMKPDGASRSLLPSTVEDEPTRLGSARRWRISHPTVYLSPILVVQSRCSGWPCDLARLAPERVPSGSAHRGAAKGRVGLCGRGFDRPPLTRISLGSNAGLIYFRRRRSNWNGSGE